MGSYDQIVDAELSVQFVSSIFDVDSSNNSFVLVINKLDRSGADLAVEHLHVSILDHDTVIVEVSGNVANVGALPVFTTALLHFGFSSGTAPGDRDFPRNRSNRPELNLLPGETHAFTKKFEF